MGNGKREKQFWRVVFVVTRQTGDRQQATGPGRRQQIRRMASVVGWKMERDGDEDGDSDVGDE